MSQNWSNPYQHERRHWSLMGNIKKSIDSQKKKRKQLREARENRRKKVNKEEGTQKVSHFIIQNPRSRMIANKKSIHILSKDILTPTSIKYHNKFNSSLKHTTQIEINIRPI